ncbi:DUF4331 domain-containing protein [Luteolibacter arcticus]|uniref:DUF4331 domain-containing protein n=1 Tax=Luteolibacter arcticus TaxID=1581411 RepID=A0ABT3GEM3_9BACT|nr:DUF4331 domain-containing protein [Luteolibacter arcticus]MCW1922062.1 DUF4331 domain-containing protein [Luteolibacter arcticus]
MKSQPTEPSRLEKAAAILTPIKSTAGLALATFLLSGPIQTATASSHSDAPLIKQDPQANLTDLYAFVRARPTGERVLVVQVSVRPFSEPGDGAMYEAFSSDARYSIHITNPVTGVEALRYDFQFSPVDSNTGDYKNFDTILRYGRGANIAGNPDAGAIQTIGDAHQNFVQTYTVTMTDTRPKKDIVTRLDRGFRLIVAPPNTGPNITPRYNDANGFAVSGAINRAALDPYTNQATYDLSGGTTVFCGPREDGFYADTPAIFDLLDGRILDNNGTPGFGQDGNGVDGFKGFNTLHYAIVIPLTQLPSYEYTGALQPASTGVGVYASVSRPEMTLRRTTFNNRDSGDWIQVNRLGNPLFNEVLVAIGDKDRYNRTQPNEDKKFFQKYAEKPELAVLVNALYGTSFQTMNRADLVGIFIPDVVRVNTTTNAIRTAGDPGFNRLSFIGGDTVPTNLGAGPAIPSGWPNGRRFGDDVVDIALTALANGPAFAAPLTVVGDNVDTNDQLYNRTFPYAATPHSGLRNQKDSGENN